MVSLEKKKVYSKEGNREDENNFGNDENNLENDTNNAENYSNNSEQDENKENVELDEEMEEVGTGTKEKKFKCVLCSKMFVKVSHLARHRKECLEMHYLFSILVDFFNVLFFIIVSF